MPPSTIFHNACAYDCSMNFLTTNYVVLAIYCSISFLRQAPPPAQFLWSSRLVPCVSPLQRVRSLLQAPNWPVPPPLSVFRPLSRRRDYGRSLPTFPPREPPFPRFPPLPPVHRQASAPPPRRSSRPRQSFFACH